MTPRTIAALAAALLILASCGGGSGSSKPPGMERMPPPDGSVSQDFSRATTPLSSGLAQASRPSHEPASTDPTGVFAVIGGANPQQMFLAGSRGCTLQRCYPTTLRTSHGGVEIGHVQVRDGASTDELLRYLRADDKARQRGRLLRWGSTPPTVRMVAGSTDQDIFETQMVVRLINSALPTGWQLRFDNTPVSREHQLTPGIIKVGFVPRTQWPDSSSSLDANTIGVAYTNISSSGLVTAGAALVDPNSTDGARQRGYVLLHELLHTLGRGHVDPSAFPDTIMHARGDQGISEWLILNRLDEAALHAVYNRFRPGTTSADLNHENLGPWSDVSTHVYGRIGYVPGRFDAVIFGAVWQNGNVRPYATAFYPAPPLVDGPRRGSASWSGRLIGLTPRAEAVAGAADMTLQLQNLNGTLDFTRMEKWTPHVAPGALGSGVQWGDGDLNYRIAVDGEVFYETGGDAGKVTGAFFGPNHERTGGTLRRSDLAAGFGGLRQ